LLNTVKKWQRYVSPRTLRTIRKNRVLSQSRQVRTVVRSVQYSYRRTRRQQLRRCASCCSSSDCCHPTKSTSVALFVRAKTPRISFDLLKTPLISIMFATYCIRVSSSLGGTSKRAAVALRQRTFSTAVKRNYMSTQPLASPEEEPRMMLILGKPGGGKGTISNKILKVRAWALVPRCLADFHRVAVRRSLLDTDRNAFPRLYSRHGNGTFPLLNLPLMNFSYNQYIQSSHTGLSFVSPYFNGRCAAPAMSRTNELGSKSQKVHGRGKVGSR